MSIEKKSNAWGIKASNTAAMAVGKDVNAWCGRCKMNRLHTIVTLEASRKPGHVQCRSCKSEHKFRLKDEDTSNQRSGGHGMFDQEEEHDAPAEPTEVFLSAEDSVKKGKARPKKKKAEGESSSSGSKSGASVPLSMMKPSQEDLAQFQHKFSALKANPNAAVRDYGASAPRFNPGEIMKHKTFGVGFVVAENGRDKVEVLFEVGRKLLVTQPK